MKNHLMRLSRLRLSLIILISIFIAAFISGFLVALNSDDSILVATDIVFLDEVSEDDLDFVFTSGGSTNTEEEIFYVDPTNGNDANAGQSPNAAVRSVARAQQLVRSRVQANTTKNILVYLRAGYHQVSQPLQFNSSDSKAGITVTYAGFPGESAIVSGHVQLPSQWQSQGNNVWALSYAGPNASNWSFADLYLNGSQRARSRYPQQGYIRVNNTNANLRNITLTNDIPAFNSLSTHAVFLNDWATSRSLITTVRANNTRTVGTRHPAGFEWHPLLKARPNTSGYFDNVPMNLASAGTWSYDDATKTLYYKANAGENPNNMTAFTSVAPQLLVIDGGSANNRVQNLRFIGLEFQFSNGWFAPSDGYRGYQAGTFNEASDGYERRKEFRPAVVVTNARRINFINNQFSNLTGNGLHVGTATNNIRVLSNTFDNIGVNCVRVGDTYDIAGGHANAVRVAHNRIRRCGTIVPDAVGIWQGYSRQVRINNNTLANLPYSGISLGWRWDDRPTSQSNNQIVDNRITNVLHTLADGGAIYTLGNNPNTTIAGNLISNVRRSEFATGSDNNPIFLDQITTGITVVNNAAFDYGNSQPIRYNLTSADRNNIGANYFGGDAAQRNQSAGHSFGLGIGFNPFYIRQINATQKPNGVSLITWDAVTGATGYEVTVRKYNKQNKTYGTPQTKTNTTDRVNIRLSPGTYSISVRYQRNGAYSRASEPVFYTISQVRDNLQISKDNIPVEEISDLEESVE